MKLEAAAIGTGNTVAVTGLFLLERQADLQRSGVRFYRVRPKAAGKLGVEACDFAALARLPDEEKRRKQFILGKDWESQVLEHDPESLFPKLLEEYIAVGPQQRAAEVTGIRSTLEELRKTNAAPFAKVEAIMSAVERTFVINKASLQLDKASITLAERTIAGETQSVVNSALAMIEESKLGMHLVEAFKSLSNGQTVNHVQRVFSNFCSFLYYYNQRQNQRVSQNIRLVFQHEYLEAYRRILPELKPHLYVSDNLIQLPRLEPPELKRFALGAFLHDIGKVANLDYFESNAGYDPQEIRQHVFVSAGLILMNYGSDHEDARLMAGDHHNALFHKDGYSVTRWERERGVRKLAETVRCVSASADEYSGGLAKGYLPVEILAIVDIYDAMTDRSRSYKQVMDPAQAIAFMTEKPLAAGKIDPVLFDLFVDYLKSTGVDLPEDCGLNFKISRRRVS